MRIGIDCRTYGEKDGYRGIYIQNLVSYIHENEDQNEYVLYFHEQEFATFVSHSSHIHTVQTSIKIESIAEQILMPYELWKEKLDCMLFSHPCSPIFYKWKAILLLIDLVPYFYPEKHLKWWFLKYWKNFILRYSIQKAHKTIALSQSLKHDLIELFNIQEEKISIIPPMLWDYENIYNISEMEIKQFFLKEGISKPYILSVWDLREYKNIPRLLQAYNLFLKESAQDIDLILIWKEEATYHEIRSTIIQLGLQNRVHIYNSLKREQIKFFYTHAHCFISASLYEGTEFLLLPPMLYRLPIASSSLPSIMHLSSKEQIYLFRPMSIVDIQNALTKITTSVSRISYDQDMNKYSISHVSQQLINTLSL